MKKFILGSALALLGLALMVSPAVFAGDGGSKDLAAKEIAAAVKESSPIKEQICDLVIQHVGPVSFPVLRQFKNTGAHYSLDSTGNYQMKLAVEKAEECFKIAQKIQAANAGTVGVSYNYSTGGLLEATARY